MSLVAIEHDFSLSYVAIGDITAYPPTIFLHGIMGNKKNLVSFVRRLHDACPHTSSVIVDLRNHGESSKHWSPYTVLACAEDLWRFATCLGISPRAVVGHSFGGKVALCAAGFLPSVEQVWMLDCPPGEVVTKNPLQAASKSALEIIDILSGISWPVSSRRVLVDSLLSLGVSNAIALWMTTNLHPDGQGYSLVFNPLEIRAMLLDFIALDCWPEVACLGSRLDIHLVAAEYGNRVTKLDEERLYALVPKQRAYYHLVAKAGHFVHSDNPERLVEIMRPFF